MNLTFSLVATCNRVCPFTLVSIACKTDFGVTRRPLNQNRKEITIDTTDPIPCVLAFWSSSIAQTKACCDSRVHLAAFSPTSPILSCRCSCVCDFCFLWVEKKNWVPSTPNSSPAASFGWGDCWEQLRGKNRESLGEINFDLQFY